MYGTNLFSCTSHVPTIFCAPTNNIPVVQDGAREAGDRAAAPRPPDPRHHPAPGHHHCRGGRTDQAQQQGAQEPGRRRRRFLQQTGTVATAAGPGHRVLWRVCPPHAGPASPATDSGHRRRRAAAGQIYRDFRRGRCHQKPLNLRSGRKLMLFMLHCRCWAGIVQTWCPCWCYESGHNQTFFFFLECPTLTGKQ